MKPHQLQAFVAVSRQGSIRGAALALGVTPPAVTKILHELERELGAALIERSVKGIHLTECGRAFLPRARVLLDDMRRAREEVTQIRDGSAGQVRVGVSTAVAQTMFVPAYMAMRDRHPRVSVYVSEGTVPSLFARLLEAQLDLVVAHVPPMQARDGLECETLFMSSMVIGMRSQHPLRNRRHIRDLLDMEWILPGDGGVITQAATQAFASVGLPVPRRVVQSDSVTAALALVAQTDMVGEFVEPVAERMFAPLGIRRLRTTDPLPALPVCAITRSSSTLTPAASQFVTCIREASSGHLPP